MAHVFHEICVCAMTVAKIVPRIWSWCVNLFVCIVFNVFFTATLAGSAPKTSALKQACTWVTGITELRDTIPCILGALYSNLLLDCISCVPSTDTEDVDLALLLQKLSQTFSILWQEGRGSTRMCAYKTSAAVCWRNTPVLGHQPKLAQLNQIHVHLLPPWFSSHRHCLHQTIHSHCCASCPCTTGSVGALLRVRLYRTLRNGETLSP